MLNGMTSPLAFPHALMVIIAKRYALLFREREPFSFHSSYAATNTCASVNTAFVGACKIPRKEVGITRVHVFVRFVLARVRVRACARACVVGMCNKTCTAGLCRGMGNKTRSAIGRIDPC